MEIKYAKNPFDEFVNYDRDYYFLDDRIHRANYPRWFCHLSY